MAFTLLTLSTGRSLFAMSARLPIALQFGCSDTRIERKLTNGPPLLYHFNLRNSFKTAVTHIILERLCVNEMIIYFGVKCSLKEYMPDELDTLNDLEQRLLKQR